MTSFFIVSDYELPPVDFTREELTYLQDMLNRERAEWFNYYEALLEEGEDYRAKEAYKNYEILKSLRTKVYHLNGRDTLATGNHEQRWWDQKHGYE